MATSSRVACFVLSYSISMSGRVCVRQQVGRLEQLEYFPRREVVVQFETAARVDFGRPRIFSSRNAEQAEPMRREPKMPMDLVDCHAKTESFVSASHGGLDPNVTSDTLRCKVEIFS
jgi:hypothetical protein